MESLDARDLRQLGFSQQDAERGPDVYVKIPDRSEAVLRFTETV
jgi:hypothetical protein